jgi:hypothetical protein
MKSKLFLSSWRSSRSQSFRENSPTVSELLEKLKIEDLKVSEFPNSDLLQKLKISKL